MWQARNVVEDIALKYAALNNATMVSRLINHPPSDKWLSAAIREKLVKGNTNEWFENPMQQAVRHQQKEKSLRLFVPLYCFRIFTSLISMRNSVRYILHAIDTSRRHMRRLVPTIFLSVSPLIFFKINCKVFYAKISRFKSIIFELKCKTTHMQGKIILYI